MVALGLTKRYERSAWITTCLSDALLSSQTPQKRKELLQERQKDPGVLVDIPNTPGPEEYGIAEFGLGEGVARRSSVVAVTPADIAGLTVDPNKP